MTMIKAGNGVRCSAHVEHNGIGYFVEVPPNADADFVTQVRETLQSLDAEMRDAGTERSQLLMVHIYLTDIARIAEFNVIWDAWLDGAKPPMRACVEPAKLANPKYVVELVANAAVPA